MRQRLSGLCSRDKLTYLALPTPESWLSDYPTLEGTGVFFKLRDKRTGTLEKTFLPSHVEVQVTTAAGTHVSVYDKTSLNPRSHPMSDAVMGWRHITRQVRTATVELTLARLLTSKSGVRLFTINTLRPSCCSSWAKLIRDVILAYMQALAIGLLGMYPSGVVAFQLQEGGVKRANLSPHVKPQNRD